MQLRKKKQNIKNCQKLNFLIEILNFLSTITSQSSSKKVSLIYEYFFENILHNLLIKDLDYILQDFGNQFAAYIQYIF